MIQIVIDSDQVDKLEADLKRFGRDAPEVFNKILSTVSSSYRGYVRSNYLSGQMLHRVTGRLWQSMKYKKSRNKRHQYIISGQPKLANIYEYPGGTIIEPVKKKWLRWIDAHGIERFSKRVRVIQRPFMSMSAARYNFGSAFDASCTKVIDKELKKRGIG